MALSWEGWVSLAVLLIGLVVLFWDKIKPEFVLLGMVTVLVAAQCLDPGLALEGFSSSAVWTVMALFVVAEGVSQTGALDAFFRVVLGRPSSSTAAAIRMMLPVGFWSAFLNNTPVVALMIPIVTTWSRAIKVPLGQLMIPLSYVSELGGVCTLIGTSTNLVVQGLYDEARAADPSLPQLTIFSQARYGVPICIMGMVYITALGRRLLPGHKSARASQLEVDQEPLKVGMRVLPTSPVVGRTLAESGLEDIDDLHVTHVVRAGETLPLSALKHVTLDAGDEVYVAGDMMRVDELATQLTLAIVTDEHDVDFFVAPPGSNGKAPALVSREASSIGAPLLGRHSVAVRRSSDASAAAASATINLVKARVRPDADVVRRSIRDVGFRSRFDAAVVCIKRGGSQVAGALGPALLHAGDELLLDVGPEFDRASEDCAATFEAIEHVTTTAKQFMVALRVEEGSRIVGLSIRDAGLRGLQEAFVVQLQRGDTRIHAIAPTIRLQAGDVIWCAANGAGAIQTLRNIKGLAVYSGAASPPRAKAVHRELVQVALSAQSPLLGRTVEDADFGGRFNAMVLALHRGGERVMTGMDRVQLQTGDILLLDATTDFAKLHDDDPAFALLAPMNNSTPRNWNRRILAFVLLILMIVLQVAESLAGVSYVPLVFKACAVAGVMLVTGCLSVRHAHAALKWDVFLVIGAALGLSKALEVNGVAKLIANGLVNLGAKLGGDIFIQFAMYVATALLSNVVANNAAAAILFSIMLEISREQGIPLEILAYLLMFGASSAFMTPYGYQTNLMVQDIGGYKPLDYLKFGGPMQIWQAVVTIAIIAFPDRWYVSWLVVGIVSALVMGPPLLGSTPVMLRLKRHASPASADTELRGERPVLQNDIATP